MQKAIRDFIVDNLGWRGDRHELTSDYPLIEGDVLDSMGIFELVGYLEERFNIMIEDLDVVPENFATIASVESLIRSKQQELAPPRP